MKGNRFPADARSLLQMGLLLTVLTPELVFLVFLLLSGRSPVAVLRDSESLGMSLAFLFLAHILHIPLVFLLWVYVQAVTRGQGASAGLAFRLAVPVAFLTAIPLRAGPADRELFASGSPAGQVPDSMAAPASATSRLGAGLIVEPTALL